jgi:hypothetical protein
MQKSGAAEDDEILLFEAESLADRNRCFGDALRVQICK